VQERYRQTTDRQTDGRQQIANVNVSSRSLKMADDNTHGLKSGPAVSLKLVGLGLGLGPSLLVSPFTKFTN